MSQEISKQQDSLPSRSLFHDKQRTATPQDYVALSLEDRTLPDSPPAPSLFLCPSNLGALLETASQSLGVVSVDRREGDFSRCERGEGVFVKGHCEDDTTTLREKLSPVSCEKEQLRETQTLEIHLPLDVGVNDIHDPSLPQLAPPIPEDMLPDHVTSSLPTLYVHNPPSTCSSPLPLLNSPIRTKGEPSHSPHMSHPHTSPIHSRSDHTQDRHLCSQLSIPMDQIDEEEGVCQMGGTSYVYPYSQRSSMASSMSSVPTNEWDVPYNYYGNRADSFQVHSRNVSETPSIPPYHCSSTSSAYHSRNSSFGSQFSSSCFESDSMLTDIDGSHADLKHPIRIQDSRVSRLGESSPMSYTSEWSQRHHMNRPIGSSDQSPSLEETLQNMHLESLEERKKLASLKSSEWIKRQLSMCRESLVHVKVSSKTKHVVHFNVRAGDIIVWEFATKKKDIAFGVLFEATQVAIEQPEECEEMSCPEDKIVSILPMFRMNTHARPVFGTHTATQDGVYEIVFDNTYSRFFAKELFYRITTQPSDDSDH